MLYFFKVILFFFLLLPKIALNKQTGLMLGELLLFAGSASILALSGGRLKFKPLILILLAFFTWFLPLSSLLNGLIYGMAPLSPMVYYIKILNYFFLFFIAYKCYEQLGFHKSLKLFISAFIIHYIIAMGIVIAFYITHKPSIGDIMWNYETGIRAIPIAGLAIDPSSFAGLTPIGGGSSNLFVSWALAFAVLLAVIPTKIKYKNLFLFLCFLVPFAGMSRGGMLSFFIFLLYLIFLSKGISLKGKTYFFVSVVLIIFLLSVIISNTDIAIPNVFERLTQTFDSNDNKGGIDPSSMGRFENYKLLFQAWSSDPLSVIFGLGMDENLMKFRTGWGLVESFFLQVLFCGGLFGVALLGLFYSLLYMNRNLNVWFKALWIFVLIESIFMWSVTGGDFYSPHVMFVIMVFLGFGYADLDKIKGNLSKYESITVN